MQPVRHRRGSRYVIVEETEHYGVFVVRRSKGELTVADIGEAIEDYGLEGAHTAFFYAPQFDGFLGEDGAVQSTQLLNLSMLEYCPVCSKAWEEMRTHIYEAAYQDGYKAGQGNQ